MNAQTELLEIQREVLALEKIAARGGASDLLAVLEARREQVEKHGHTEEKDLERTPSEILKAARERIIAAGDHLMRNTPEDNEIAYRNCARSAAVILATMRRIRREKAK